MSSAISGLFGPSSIFYPPFMLSALALTLGWLAVRHRLGIGASLALLFARDAWLTRSTLVDLSLSLFNLTFWRTAVAATETSAFFFALALPRGLGELLDARFGFRSTLALPVAIEALFATAIAMLAFDFASYFAHRALHRWVFLWEIHSVHHSAEKLTWLTTYRQHPLEPIFLNGARGAAAGLGLGFFHLFFPQSTPVVTIFGLGAGFFAYMFTVNLHHSTVPLIYPGWLKHVLISPHVHQLHHSAEKRHHDRNFGVVFSFWDRIFGTYLDEEIGLKELRFGLYS